MSDLLLRTKMGKDGRIVIPAKARAALGYKAGTVFNIGIKNRRLVIEDALSAFERLSQELKHMHWKPGQKMASEELIEERRAEARREGV